jgi:hypothetical protein
LEVPNLQRTNFMPQRSLFQLRLRKVEKQKAEVSMGRISLDFEDAFSA